MAKSFLNSLPANAKIALVALLVAVVVCGWCGKQIKERFWDANPPGRTEQPGGQPSNPSAPPTSPQQAEVVYLALGNPSRAGTEENNYLLVNKYFALSYSRRNGTP